MAQGNIGNVEYIDDVTRRKFVLPITWDVWDKMSPMVQDRVLQYYINTTIQGERMSPQLQRQPEMTPKLAASPFSNTLKPNIPPKSPLSAGENIISNLVTPFAKNVEGLMMGMVHPETFAQIPEISRKYYEQESQKVNQNPQIGPIEGMGRKIGGAVGGVLGTAGLQEAAENVDYTNPASIARLLGEVGALGLPIGGVHGGKKLGQAAQSAETVMRNRIHGAPSFNRVVGSNQFPEIQAQIPRTAVEMAEETKGGPTFTTNLFQNIAQGSTQLDKFNTGRIERISAELRRLPISLKNQPGAIPTPTSVQAQTLLKRVPAGSNVVGVGGKTYKGGQIAKVQAITKDTDSLLGLPERDAAADLAQLPYESIQNIVGDVNSGVFPRVLFKQYFTEMLNQVVEGHVPAGGFNIPPGARREAGINTVLGGTLMRELEKLSRDSYKTPSGSSMGWNRLQQLAQTAGVDGTELTNNLATLASQLEHLQVQGKLGPKVERINLSASIPIEAGPGGHNVGRLIGTLSIPASIGGVVGYGMGGGGGAAIGTMAGAGVGIALPGIVARAVTNPRILFALNQYLRLNAAASSEMASARRLMDIVKEEDEKQMAEAARQVQNQTRQAQGEILR